jgi:chorismate-pyruvate lyase
MLLISTGIASSLIKINGLLLLKPIKLYESIYKLKINIMKNAHQSIDVAEKKPSQWTLYNLSLIPSADFSILKGNSFNVFQKVIMATDGTVTDLIALYTGDVIKVNIIDQEISADVPPFLQPSPSSSVLRRIVILHGPDKNYVYAESIFVIDRLSPGIQKKLLETDQPIGLLWKQEKLESYREILEIKLETNQNVSTYFGEVECMPLLSRTYAIYHDKTILGVITEKFPITTFRKN